MKKIEFNINEMAQVALTDEGTKILEHFLKRYPQGVPDDLKLDERKILRGPLWQIMFIFGSSFGMDQDNVFLENRIQIEIPNDGSRLYIKENDIHNFVWTL